MSSLDAAREALDANRTAEIGFLLAACLVVLLALSLPFVAAEPEPRAADATAAAAFDPEPGPSIPATVDSDDEASASGDGRATEGLDADATATVNGEPYDTASVALDAAEPGDTVVLDGTFHERVNVSTDDVSLVAGEDGGVLDGGGEGRVLTVDGENVTVEGLWIRGSGDDVGAEDAGVFVAGDGAVLHALAITDSAYGVWVDGADGVTIANARIEGRDDVHPRTERGNGIHLFDTRDTVVRDVQITEVRDGIYFSWSERVLAENNTIWNARYGVHYMYSDDNRLVDNVAVDNGVGYALMVSEGLEVVNNTAVRNADTSGHGILAKDIERSEISGNVLVENRNGLYVYNAQDNLIADNLLLRNDVGIHSSGGSEGQTIHGNSFVDNARAVETPRNTLVAWNGTDRGNYWSDARVADRTGDGVSEIRHRPSGLVEHLIATHPQAAVFANSPAFEAVRLAESSFPVIESPGVVDQRPLVEPPHDVRRFDSDEPLADDGTHTNGYDTTEEP